MSLFATIALIGVVATTAMTLFLYAFSAVTNTRVDMLSAIGTLITREPRRAFVYGLVIHTFAGIFFAYIYLAIASYFGFHTWFDFLGFGAVIGLAHGVVVSILAVVLIAEHHPLARFRAAGFKVVAAFGLAHVVYGLAVGSASAYLQLDLSSMNIFATGIM